MHYFPLNTHPAQLSNMRVKPPCLAQPQTPTGGIWTVTFGDAADFGDNVVWTVMKCQFLENLVEILSEA